MGDRNFSVKLGLKDICAIKHALQKQLRHKQALLKDGHFISEEDFIRVQNDVQHEVQLVEIFTMAESEFRQKYHLSK